MGIIRYRKWFFLVSGLLILASIVSLLIPPALRAGIDFTGGAAITANYQEEVTTEQISQALANVGFPEAIIQAEAQADRFFIRTGQLELDVRDEEGNVVVPGDESRIREALAGVGAVEIESFDFVSGIVGAENVRNAVIAVIVASAAILLYVTWAFRKVPSPFRYGACAIIALFHDAFLILGLFSILGKTIGLEVNSMFITGVLLVIGYSVNDTIVVFDRVRENVARYMGAPLGEVVGLSIRETIPRSLNTSITLLVVVVALILFAGEAIRPLLFVAAAGVVVGTYSSIFTAGLLLVAWENGELAKLFRWLPGRRRRPAIAR